MIKTEVRGQETNLESRVERLSCPGTSKRLSGGQKVQQCRFSSGLGYFSEFAMKRFSSKQFTFKK